MKIFGIVVPTSQNSLSSQVAEPEPQLQPDKDIPLTAARRKAQKRAALLGGKTTRALSKAEKKSNGIPQDESRAIGNCQRPSCIGLLRPSAGDSYFFASRFTLDGPLLRAFCTTCGIEQHISLV